MFPAETIEHPERGLGEELFLKVSSLVPIVNVDLLVYNKNNQFLLAWRDDPHCGQGWHVPGGCIRFKETAHERLLQVAKNELNMLDLAIESDPCKVFEIIERNQRPIANQNERAHFITLVYRARAAENYEIDNREKIEGDIGFLRWFDKFPANLLPIQDCYRKILL